MAGNVLRLCAVAEIEKQKMNSAILNLKHIPANILGCHNLLLTITKELNA